MSKSFQSNSKRLSLVALAISFGVNMAVILPKVNLTPRESVAETKPEEKRIRITFKELEREEDKKQIVQTQLNGREEKPENSKFLGEKDQTFDTFKEAGKGVRNGTVAAQAQRPQKQDKKAEKRPVDKVTFSDLALAKKIVVEDKQKSAPAANLGVENGAYGETGLASNNDHLEDIPLGDMTHLNTVEFKYYGFYHRIRQRLEQHWGATLREKVTGLYRRGGRIPASENRVTSLRITIDDRGQIQKVFIKSTSGVTELDDAAVESFNKAGPFPNPPAGMLTNGYAEIEWGFVVKG
jgi:TonB family protein